LQAAPNEMALLCNNLPSGYHRDLQLTKDILFPACDSMNECLTMLCYALQEVKVRKDILNHNQFDHLFTVEEINKLVVKGIPFREAYKAVGNAVNDGTFKTDRKMLHTHQGSINNLCTGDIKAMMERVCSHIKL
jgi:argininosuccinate lyase